MWLVSHSGHFTPKERGPWTEQKAGVGPRVILNIMTKRKMSMPLPVFDPWLFSLHVEWAITAFSLMDADKL
jgi:hypothetical protein